MADTSPGSLLLSQLMKGNGVPAMDEENSDIAIQGTCLKVSNPALGAAGCSRVLQTVQSQMMLTEIDLTGCNIDKGNELAEIIQSSQHLKKLVLEWNNLGLARTGITSMVSAMALNPTLQELDLRSNRIGPSFAVALANALKSSRSLNFLDLRWNSIGPSGAGAFITLLQKNPILTSIQLAGNAVPQKLLSQIDKIIEANRSRTVVPHSRPHVRHPLEEDNFKVTNREGMEAIYFGKVAALEDEVKNLMVQADVLKKEKDDLRLAEVEVQNQLKTVRLELTEEALLRKYIDKECGDLKEQLVAAKQELAACQEKMAQEVKTANAAASAQSAARAESERKEQVSRELYESTLAESKALKDEILHLKREHSTELKIITDQAEADSKIKQSTIEKLEVDLAASNHTMEEEINKVRAQLTTEMKVLETEKQSIKSSYEQEIEKLRNAAVAAEGQYAARIYSLQQEKEAAEKNFNARIGGLKTDIDSLQAEVDAMRRDFTKLKKKHASEIEEYVSSIAEHKSLQHRTELSKSDLEEKIFTLTSEKVQLEEKMKLSDDKERLLDKRLELEKLKYTEQASFENTRHLEEKRKMETELEATRKLIENTQKHLQELQREQERRKLDVDKRVIGVEATFIEWIRQQFAGLRAANSHMQPFITGDM